jgi:hypothetical protein
MISIPTIIPDNRELSVLICCDQLFVVYRPVDVGSVSEPRKVFETSDSAPECPINNDTVNNDEVKQRGKEILKEVRTNLASILTVHNVKDVLVFMSVFIVTCVTGFFHLVRYVGDYSIRFMREFSVFIQASTPIFIAVIDLFGKCVGGFYVLIFMLWRSLENILFPWKLNERASQSMLWRGAENVPLPWGPSQRALPASQSMKLRYRKY